MKKSNITLVKLAAKKLIKKNGVTSTLEVKNELRSIYPTTKWFQSDISDIMDDWLNTSKRLTFFDNGNFREYKRIPKKKKAKIVSKTKQWK